MSSRSTHRMQMQPLIVQPGQSPVIDSYGDPIHVHLNSENTDGRFVMFMDLTPPGGGPPPHFHAAEDEWFFVLEGQVEFLKEGDWVAVPAGTLLYSPKNTVHAFRNAGSTTLRMLTHLSPSGFESFYKESEAEFQSGRAPDMGNLIGIAARHEIYFPTLDPTGSTKPASTPAPSILRRPDERQTLHAFGEQVEILLSGEETNGEFTMFIETTSPGGGPPPHFHDREDEWFYVLEGTVSFFINGQWTDVAKGGAVLTPRGHVHTFKNNTAEVTRMVIHASPCGFEKFFAEAAGEFARPGGPDMQRAVAIAEAHGIHFIPEG